MQILMLTHFPPMRGGIAAYADQAVTQLRKQGHEVNVASPQPSDAEYVIDVRKRGAGRALARLARAHDRLIVQFHPELLGPPGSSLLSRTRSLLRLGGGLRAARAAELVVHEMNYGAGPTAPLQRLLVRPIWKLAEEITVHTEGEREDFASGFRISKERIRVVSQAQHMLRRTQDDRGAARAALGLPDDARILLSIGFLQPNKGFDRALRAFAAVAHDGTRLYVVGSAFRDDTDGAAHVDELRRLADETQDAELREDFVSDEDFDRWIVAADALVLPYRYGWSSNVMERGILYGRPVVMSRIGGMAEQGGNRDGVTLVADDEELIEAVRALARGDQPR